MFDGTRQSLGPGDSYLFFFRMSFKITRIKGQFKVPTFILLTESTIFDVEKMYLRRVLY